MQPKPVLYKAVKVKSTERLVLIHVSENKFPTRQFIELAKQELAADSINFLSQPSGFSQPM